MKRLDARSIDALRRYDTDDESNGRSLAAHDMMGG